jgi:hypothetical protein
LHIEGNVNTNLLAQKENIWENLTFSSFDTFKAFTFQTKSINVLMLSCQVLKFISSFFFDLQSIQPDDDSASIVCPAFSLNRRKLTAKTLKELVVRHRFVSPDNN